MAKRSRVRVVDEEYDEDEYEEEEERPRRRRKKKKKKKDRSPLVDVAIAAGVSTIVSVGVTSWLNTKAEKRREEEARRQLEEATRIRRLGAGAPPAGFDPYGLD